MRQVRRGTFETNSSSTHSITICSEEQITKWKNGELFYFEDGDKFVDAIEKEKIIREKVLCDKIKKDWKEKTITFKEEVISFYFTYQDRDSKKEKYMTEENLAEITQEEIDEFIEKCDYVRELPCGYEEYFDSFEYLSTYVEHYTTPKGEEIIAFGCYGYEG